jgi:GNAT superfamily N-acetyltransferase
LVRKEQHVVTEVIERLDGGLLLRRATAADVEPLADFNAAIHGAPGPPDLSIATWARDLLTRPHPTFGDGGFLLVQEESSGRIVSSLNLIPQTWSYAGVPFGVGRVELVGTLPEYRRRGLVRLQMDEVHRWCLDLALPVQIITGIANFYRQFGYEQGLSMTEARAGYRYRIPPLAEGDSEPFTVRPATVEDAEFLAGLEEQARPRSLLSVPRDAALWRYEVAGITPGHTLGRLVRIVEAGPGAPRPAGERVGYLVHDPARAPTVSVMAYELLPGLSWLAVTPSVLRYLQAYGDGTPSGEPGGDGGAAGPQAGAPGGRRRFERFRFELGPAHPVYHTLPQRLTETQAPDTEYVRVPDLPGFVRHIGAVLERRLAQSVAVGHSGRLRLSFFGDGLLLRFESGRLLEVAPCPHFLSAAEAGPLGARFPDLTFLQLLFGCRSLEELEGSYGACRAVSEEGRVLLNVLFPKLPSLIWPVS